MVFFPSFDDAERNLNAMLKPQLHKVHTSLKLNSEVTATNVDILNTLLYDIRIKIKLEDPLFRRLFKRLEYTGSYYDGLRTKMADEFDINLVLDLPFRKDEFTVLDGCPGYVGYGVNPAAKDRLIREEDTKWVQLLLKWMDGENRLLPDKVKRWLQSAFDRVLRTYVIPSGSCSAVDKILSSQHGPAITLHIKLKDGITINVDLVPVVEFCDPSWPKSIQKKDWMAKMLPKDCNWFLIPKAPEQKSHLWRLHFPNMEKRLIEDYGCVKPIIRLLKATRDSHMWNLSSYSLKTFVMSLVVANHDSRYWHSDNQGMLFVRVLDFLAHVLAQPGPAISFLFHPELDLTERVTRETRDNISCRIKRIVRKLWLSPDQCYELVLKNHRKGQAFSRLRCGEALELHKMAASTPWMSVLRSALVVGEKHSQGSWRSNTSKSTKCEEEK
ncbi:cyclic GMP-AMP synthase isoform X1 [Ixodes scapularis]